MPSGLAQLRNIFFLMELTFLPNGSTGFKKDNAIFLNQEMFNAAVSSLILQPSSLKTTSNARWRMSR